MATKTTAIFVSEPGALFVHMRCKYIVLKLVARLIFTLDFLYL